MKTNRTLLVAAGLSATVLSAALATAVDLQPLVVPNPVGTLHMQQSLPCDKLVAVDTDVTGGRIEMSPARGLDLEGGDKIFNLTRMTLLFKRFTVRGDCRGIRDTHKVSEIAVQLASAVSFRAPAAGRDTYFVRIPRDQILLTETFTDNGAPKIVYLRPSNEVTGLINLTGGTVRLHIEVGALLQFRAGCTSLGCTIDEILPGTQTADIAGAIVFPATPVTAPR